MEPMEEDGLPVTNGVQYSDIPGRGNADMLQAGVQAGNIYRQNAGAEVMDLPEAGNQQRTEDLEKIRQLELKRAMKNIVVPVIDAEVRALLRQLDEPITLFGEREMERRDRLRQLLATMTDEKAEEFAARQAQQEEHILIPQAPPKEIFYTEGIEELKTARLSIAQFSLHRAHQRITAEKENRLIEHQKEHNKSNAMDTDGDPLQQMTRRLKVMVNQTSEIAGERPVVTCRYAPDGSFLVTGSWSGKVNVWSTEPSTMTVQHKVVAHEDRITGIDCHPSASKSADMSSTLAFASGSVDCTAKLWSYNGTLLRTLQGHTDRLARMAFHPMGQHLATASYDLTWCFWDVETGKCLAEQEGHSRPVYTVAFQKDGALAVSGGLDGYGRIWDVRTGKSIMLLEGHIKGVLASDFSPNGYYVATGGLDHTARIFDLRKKGPFVVLPGHTSLISQVRFAPNSGEYLLSSGYDGMSKLWCGKKFTLTKSMAGHEGKVMGSDICPVDEYLIATVGYDRTLKTWHPDEHLLLVEKELAK